jgi:cobalamin biosynthesis protein CobT
MAMMEKRQSTVIATATAIVRTTNAIFNLTTKQLEKTMVRKLEAMKKENVIPSSSGHNRDNEKDVHNQEDNKDKDSEEDNKDKDSEEDNEDKDSEKEEGKEEENKNNIHPSTLNIQQSEKKCFRCGQRKILNGICQNCGESYDN